MDLGELARPAANSSNNLLTAPEEIEGAFAEDSQLFEPILAP